MENDAGAMSSAGQECPELKQISIEENGDERSCEDVKSRALIEVTLAGDAVFQHIKEEVSAGRGSKVRAAVKLGCGLLMTIGVLAGNSDGDDSNDVGCSVAHRPRQHAGQTEKSEREPEGKGPGSGGGGGGASGGGPGNGGDFPLPECFARAEWCPYRRPDGYCPIVRGRCWALAWQLGEGRTDNGEVVERLARIERRIDDVAQGNFELRQENCELRRLQSEGLFKFALRVEPEDFHAFAAVMALGNRKAAAKFLEVPQRTFYDRVDRWAQMGPDYVRMLRMMDWRKASERKMVVRLGESLLSGATDAAENPETLEAVLATMKQRGSGDHPDVLRVVLQALKEQNAENWVAVRKELVEILEEEIPQ
jgi:hypothetical protein